MQLLLDSCPALTELSVADCTTLGALILFSRQLCTLDVSRCIHISEMSLEMPGAFRGVCFTSILFFFSRSRFFFPSLLLVFAFSVGVFFHGVVST